MKIICPGHKGSIEISNDKIIEASNNINQLSIINCPTCKEQIVIHNVWIGEEPPSFPMKTALIYKEHKWIFTDHQVA